MTDGSDGSPADDPKLMAKQIKINTPDTLFICIAFGTEFQSKDELYLK